MYGEVLGVRCECFPDQAGAQTSVQSLWARAPLAVPFGGPPTVWLANHATEFRQYAAIQKLAGAGPKSTWETLFPTNKGNDKNREDGGGPTHLPSKPANEAYPAGIPLKPAEIRTPRNLRPKSSEYGQFLRWGYSSHVGCKAPDDGCKRRKQEIIKLAGLRPLIRMHLSRRGGRKGAKGIQSRDIDGYVRSLRKNPIEADLKYKNNGRKKKWAKDGGETPDLWRSDPLREMHPREDRSGANHSGLFDQSGIAGVSLPGETSLKPDQIVGKISRPGDFRQVDFTDMEEEGAMLAALEDAIWVTGNGPIPLVRLHGDSLSRMQTDIDL